MKKFKTKKMGVFIGTMFFTFAFLLNVNVVKAQDTLVYWDFSLKSQVATGGIPANVNKIISRESSFSGNYSYTNSDAPGSTGDSCIYTTTWNSGIGTKFWQIEFATSLYDSIEVSSKQSSTGTGPKDFQIEYSLNGADWYLVPNSAFSLTTASDWADGTLSNIKLPSACWGQSSVYLRWIMTSDDNINGTSVASTGNNKIDDIYITGTVPAPPIVNDAYAISDSVVVVAFSKTVDTISATTQANYSFQNATGIDYIVRSYPDTVLIYLDPKLTIGIADYLTIQDVEDLSSTPMAAPQIFEIVIAPDTIPPLVLSVNTISCNVFEIQFSEPVDVLTATDLSNYNLISTAVDSIAEINTNQDIVTLTLKLPGLASGSNIDTLIISGIEDLDGNIMDSIFTFPLSCLINECIVFWNFDDQDIIADGGIPVNLTSEIARESSFSGNFSFSASQGLPAPSVSTTSWHSGTGVKYWEISFASYFVDPFDGNSYNYDSLEISSAQRSSDSGPQDFQLQYYDNTASSWVDITSGTVMVKNNWTNGLITSLELPEECWGQANVKIRWLITSEVSSSGGTVAGAGTSNFDEISVCGYKMYTTSGVNITEVSSNKTLNVLVYPNPASDIVNIITSNNVDIELFDIRGVKMYSETDANNRTSLDVSSYPAGLYILSIYDRVNQNYTTKKIMVK